MAENVNLAITVQVDPRKCSLVPVGPTAPLPACLCQQEIALPVTIVLWEPAYRIQMMAQREISVLRDTIVLWDLLFGYLVNPGTT